MRTIVAEHTNVVLIIVCYYKRFTNRVHMLNFTILNAVHIRWRSIWSVKILKSPNVF